MKSHHIVLVTFGVLALILNTPLPIQEQETQAEIRDFQLTLNRGWTKFNVSIPVDMNASDMVYLGFFLSTPEGTVPIILRYDLSLGNTSDLSHTWIQVSDNSSWRFSPNG